MTSDSGNSLLSATLAGDVAQLMTLLSGSEKCPSEELIQELLATAAKSSHLETMTFLLDQYPDISPSEEVVRGAINSGSIEVVKALLRREPSLVNMHFDRRGTPLIVACMGQQRVEFLQFLLMAGADPNQDPDGATFPLVLVAALYSDPAVIDLLLQHGAHLEDSEALAAAARRGNETMVLRLLERGANPTADRSSVRSRFNDSPLSIAVKSGHTEVVEILLRYGADPAVADAGGMSSISVAEKMESGGEEVSKMLELLEEYKDNRCFT
jgi:ankyrin repeat protein